MDEKALIKELAEKISEIRYIMLDEALNSKNGANLVEESSESGEDRFKVECDEIKNLIKSHIQVVGPYGQIAHIVSTLEGLWHSLTNTKAPILESIKLYQIAFRVKDKSLKELNDEIGSDFPVSRQHSSDKLDSSKVQAMFVKSKRLNIAIKGEKIDGTIFEGVPGYVESVDGTSVWILKRSDGKQFQVEISEVKDLLY